MSDMGAGIGFDIEGDSESGRWTARIDWAAGFADLMQSSIRAELVGSGQTWLEALYVAVAKAYRESERIFSVLEPNDMSLEQLEALQKRLYDRAVQENLFDKLVTIQSVLGIYDSMNNYRRYVEGDLVIKNGTHGVEAYFKNKLVAERAGRRQDCGLFVPGAWVGIVDAAYDRAEIEKARRANHDREEKRQTLLKTLGLV